MNSEMKKNVFFYKGRTQFENIGDLLINKALLDTLSRYGKVYVDDSSIPNNYLTELFRGLNDNVKQVSKQKKGAYRWFLLFFLIRNCFSNVNTYIVGVPGHVFDLSSRKGSKSLKEVAFSIQKRVYKALKAKYFTIGISLGPFSKESIAEYAKEFRSNAFIGVRDQQSYHYAKLQLKIEKAILIPDLAWAYDMNKFHPALAPKRKEIIVLSFRGALVGKKRDDAYMAKLKKALLALSESFKEHKFVLAYQVEFDKEINREIFELLRDKVDIEIIDRLLFLDDAVSVYSEAKFVISNRLHVLLLGLKSGSTPLGLTDIANHDKLRELFNDNGLIGNLLDTEDFSKEDFFQNNLEDLVSKDYNGLRERNFKEITEVLDIQFSK